MTVIFRWEGFAYPASLRADGNVCPSSENSWEDKRSGGDPHHTCPKGKLTTLAFRSRDA